MRATKVSPVFDEDGIYELRVAGTNIAGLLLVQNEILHGLVWEPIDEEKNAGSIIFQALAAGIGEIRRFVRDEEPLKQEKSDRDATSDGAPNFFDSLYSAKTKDL